MWKEKVDTALEGCGAESVVTLQHGGCMVAHDWKGLDVKVTQHCIGFPASDKLDKVGIHSGDQEGHGAAGAKRLGSDMVGEEAERGAGRGDDSPDVGGDVVGADEAPGSGGVRSEEMQWGTGSCLIHAEVDHATGGCEDGAKEGMAAAAVCDFLAPNGVFLG